MCAKIVGSLSPEFIYEMIEAINKVDTTRDVWSEYKPQQSPDGQCIGWWQWLAQLWKILQMTCRGTEF